MRKLFPYIAVSMSLAGCGTPVSPVAPSGESIAVSRLEVTSARLINFTAQPLEEASYEAVDDALAAKLLGRDQETLKQRAREMFKVSGVLEAKRESWLMGRKYDIYLRRGGQRHLIAVRTVTQNGFKEAIGKPVTAYFGVYHFQHPGKEFSYSTSLHGLKY